MIRTIAPDGELALAFGSCRVSVPHEEPYTLKKSEDRLGHGQDAGKSKKRSEGYIRK